MKKEGYEATININEARHLMFCHPLPRGMRGNGQYERSCLTSKRAIAHSGWVRGEDCHAQAAATARGPSRESCLGRQVQGQTLLCLSCGIRKSGLCRPAKTVQRLQAIVTGADGPGKRCRSQPAHIYRRNSRARTYCGGGIRWFWTTGN